MSHTPGPWRIIPEDNWIEDANGRRICTPHSSSSNISVEERNANAHLIAAAPELLAALKQVLAHHGYIEGGPDFPGAWAAIRKAEGSEK